ncbi:hypothetical protein CDO23_16600 [Sinorhizobium meliloti]|nr:hypothetical protein CDO23_16600 [Sinorhizobium meliloti]
MANPQAKVKQIEAKRIFKAAIEAGFEMASITVHPDGRIEYGARFADGAAPAGGERNTWDDILK